MSNQASDGIATFLDECRDLLAQVEDVALALDPGAGLDGVNHLFRIFHTVKGSSAMVGFTAVSSFTHHLETVLDKVRNGELEVTSDLVSAVLSSKDHIEALVAEATGGPPVAEEDQAMLSAALDALAPSARPPSVPKVDRQRWTIRLTPRGTGPTADALEAMRTDLASLGDLTVGEGGLHLTLISETTRDRLRDFLIFVESDAEVAIDAEPYFGDVDGGIVLFDDVEPAALEQLAAPPPAAAGLIGETVPPPPQVAAPPAPAHKAPTPASPAPTPPATPTPASSKPARAETMVRVSSTKLDALVNLVGELVITQARLSQLTAGTPDAALTASVESLERLVIDLRDGVLGVQMMPIGSTFGRFKRLVHDLASKLGKKIELVTEGADTELDKSVLDQLVDPLMHLVRNAVDHGIEHEDVRVSRGKNPKGTVRLGARHEGQFVVITIDDDGNGLDSEAIRRKAVERGLISSEQTLPQSELFQLIFLPGFSTAKAVSDVSGRGVGMDVVKRQLDALRGVVTITSEPGKGARLSLRLPLTLAIIDGLLVEVDASRYIVPLSSVTEAVELPPGDRTKHNGRRAVDVRGALVPYVSLRDAFGSRGEPPPSERVVLLEEAGQRVGLVVDRVLGQRQTVIQSLGHMYRKIDVVSGATILGDGEVALILDVDGVVKRAQGMAA